MPKYRAAADYSVGINGRTFTVRAGDVVEVQPADVGPILRDCPGLFSFDHPLSPAELAEHARDVLTRHAAAIVAERADEDGLRAIREHTRRWNGPRCPGRPGVTYPAGLVPAGEAPHDAGRELLARRVETDDGGWWAVACQRHLCHVLAHGGPPTAPSYVDRTVRNYRATRRYSAVVTDYAAQGSFYVVVPEAQRPKRYTFAEGEVHAVPTHVAEWVNRDSPNTLTLIGD